MHGLSSPAAPRVWATRSPATSAAQGGRVALLDVQEGPGREAAAAIGASATFVRCDVTSEAEVNAAMDTAYAALGGLNLLVNCAGVVGAGRVLGKNGPMAGEFFTKVIHINLIGTFLCDKAAAALMQNNAPAGPDGERGLLIHTSSVAAFEGQIGQAAYSATKAAVAGMTLPIARELARLGIRCVSIAPGIFHTPMMDAMSAGSCRHRWQRRYRSRRAWASRRNLHS